MNRRICDPPLRPGWARREKGLRKVGSRIAALLTGGHLRLSGVVRRSSGFLQGLPLGPFRGAPKPGYEGIGVGGAVRPMLVLKRHPSPPIAPPRGWGPRRRHRGRPGTVR